MAYLFFCRTFQLIETKLQKLCLIHCYLLPESTFAGPSKVLVLMAGCSLSHMWQRQYVCGRTLWEKLLLWEIAKLALIRVRVTALSSHLQISLRHRPKISKNKRGGYRFVAGFSCWSWPKWKNITTWLRVCYIWTGCRAWLKCLIYSIQGCLKFSRHGQHFAIQAKP